MTSLDKVELLKEIGGLKSSIEARVGFADDADLRASYVVLLTLEGAVMYDDLAALAKLCVNFCGVKSDEIALKN